MELRRRKFILVVQLAQHVSHREVVFKYCLSRANFSTAGRGTAFLAVQVAYER